MKERLNYTMNFIRKKKREFMIGVLVLVLAGTAGTFAVLSNTKAEIKDGWYKEDVAPQYYRNGELQKGLLEVDGDWFYFGEDGFMKTGFVELEGKTYYFDANGKMATGFNDIAGSTYYFDNSGVMVTGEITIDGVDYNFGVDGKLILDEGQEIEVTEDQKGNQTVVVKDEDGKEVSKVTVTENKPQNVTVSSGTTGKETGTSTSKPGTGNGGSNSGSTGGSSSGGNSNGNNSSSNTGNSNSSGSSNGGSSNSGGSTSKPGTGNGGSNSGNTGGSNGSDSSNSGTAEEKPDTSHWWDGMSVSQIRAKVTASMVWKNEITGQTYKGVDGLAFAWNQEDIVFGGLKLISNPYNVDLPYSFPGGRGGMISTDTFEMFWNLPEGTYNGMKGINLGTFTIKKPQAISADEVTKLYQ